MGRLLISWVWGRETSYSIPRCLLLSYSVIAENPGRKLLHLYKGATQQIWDLSPKEKLHRLWPLLVRLAHKLMQTEVPPYRLVLNVMGHLFHLYPSPENSFKRSHNSPFCQNHTDFRSRIMWANLGGNRNQADTPPDHQIKASHFAVVFHTQCTKNMSKST